METKKVIKCSFKNVTATGVVLNDWCFAKQKLDEAKQAEQKARQNVMQHLKTEINVGTSRFATERFTLKASMSEKYEVVFNDINELNGALGVLAMKSNAEIAKGIINWKPSLNKKLYDSLTDEQKAIINPFLKLSYSTPTFSIEGNSDGI